MIEGAAGGCVEEGYGWFLEWAILKVNILSWSQAHVECFGTASTERQAYRQTHLTAQVDKSLMRCVWLISPCILTQCAGRG